MSVNAGIKHFCRRVCVHDATPFVTHVVEPRSSILPNDSNQVQTRSERIIAKACLIWPPVAVTPGRVSESEEINLHAWLSMNVNPTLKHHPACEHSCPSPTRQILVISSRKTTAPMIPHYSHLLFLEFRGYLYRQQINTELEFDENSHIHPANTHTTHVRLRLRLVNFNTPSTLRFKIAHND